MARSFTLTTNIHGFNFAQTFESSQIFAIFIITMDNMKMLALYPITKLHAYYLCLEHYIAHFDIIDKKLFFLNFELN